MYVLTENVNYTLNGAQGSGARISNTNIVKRSDARAMRVDITIYPRRTSDFFGIDDNTGVAERDLQES